MKRPALWVAVLSYLVLTLGYLVLTPVFEAPDENTHFQYASHLANARSLPLIPGTAERNGRSRLDETIQAYHPPLYYAVLAGTMSALGDRDLVASSVPVSAPPAGEFDPRRPGAFFFRLHGADEVPPVSPEVITFRILRGWSVLFGLIALLLTHRIGLLAFPGRPAIADTAVLLLACLPKWNFMLGVLNNGNLVTALSHVALFLLALALARERLSTAFGLGLGLVVGLALNTKMTAMYLLPLAGAVYLYGLWKWPGRRLPVFRSGVALMMVAAGLASWFFARNLQLYGSLMALDVHQASFGGKLRIPEGEVWAYLSGPFLPLLFGSLVSYLGWFCFEVDHWVMTLVKVVAALASAGLLCRLLRGRLWPRAGREGDGRVVLLLLFAALLVLTLTVNYNTMMRGAHARYLFPVAGALAVLFASGLVALFDLLPRRAGRLAAPLLVLIPPLVGAAVLFLQFRPAYRPEASPAPATYASLTAGLATEPETGAIELLEPAAGAMLNDPPVLRWRAPVAEGTDPIYTIHFYTESGRVLFGTYETYYQEIRGDGWPLPAIGWDLVVPHGEPVHWKIRQVPDRARGENVGDTPESRARDFTAR